MFCSGACLRVCVDTCMCTQVEMNKKRAAKEAKKAELRAALLQQAKEVENAKAAERRAKALAKLGL
eukprot:m.167332 g.167332  ORF g.167332 m.167332 type:complete len:66 (-) comp14459_c0_seq2:320-517(-)